MRAVGKLSIGTIASCPLANELDDLPDFFVSAIQRHRCNIDNGSGKLDQCHIIRRGKKLMDFAGVTGCQCLLDQRFGQSRIGGIDNDALNFAFDAGDGYGSIHARHRCRMSCGQNPLGRNEHAMPFAGHVRQRRECRCRDPIFAIIDVASDNDGVGDG